MICAVIAAFMFGYCLGAVFATGKKSDNNDQH